MSKEPIVMSWSGGKDSALALHELLKDEQFQVVSLLTIVTKEYDRISMHGVRRELLELQSQYLKIPLVIVEITPNCTDKEYEEKMKSAMLSFKQQGVTRIAFGDLFLEDVRKYREEKLSIVNMEPYFPLWGSDTTFIIKKFCDMGFKSILTCVDTQQLNHEFAGREINEQFIADLPTGVDPCGENGEFHSFVFDGPIFNQSIVFEKGECVLRDNRFMYCDIF